MFYVMIQPAELRCCPEWWDSFPFFPCSQSVSSQLFKLSPQPWRLERDRKSEDRVQTRQYGKGKTAFLTAFLLQHPYQWNTLNCKQPPSWMRSVITVCDSCMAFSVYETPLWLTGGLWGNSQDTMNARFALQSKWQPLFAVKSRLFKQSAAQKSAVIPRLQGKNPDCVCYQQGRSKWHT